MKWEGHVARMGEMRGAYRILVGRSEGKILLERPRHRWEGNIKQIFQKGMKSHGMDRSGSRSVLVRLCAFGFHKMREIS